MLPYQDELKKKLTEYNRVKTQIEELETQKKTIRSQIDQWMKLNNLQYFEETDLLGQKWQMDYSTKTIKRTNWDFIKQVIPPVDHDKLIIKSKSKPFISIRPIKYSKKKTPNKEVVGTPFKNDVPQGEIT